MLGVGSGQGVLANDQDASTGILLTASLVLGPSHGTLTWQYATAGPGTASPGRALR